MGEVGFGGNILKDGNSMELKLVHGKINILYMIKKNVKTVCFALDIVQKIA